MEVPIVAAKFVLLFVSVVVIFTSLAVAVVRVAKCARVITSASYFHDLRQLAKKLLTQRSGELSDQRHIGYRFAYLVFSEQQSIWFGSVVHPSTFGNSARAMCMSSHDHRAPDSGCACGFYALKDVRKLPFRVFTSLRRMVLLQVELSGTVIAAQYGYRAGRQDVLRVWVPRRCAVFGCRRHAEYCIIRESSLDWHDQKLVPACWKHTVKFRRRFKGPRFTLQDLRDQLHTEFEWMG